MIERQSVGSSLDEMKAVDRLLEVAEKRSYAEDSWQQRLRPHLSMSLEMRAKERISSRHNKERSTQRRHEKERLGQLIRGFPISQHSRNEKEQSPVKTDWRARLSPLKSNLTFYRNQRESDSNGISSSMTFYGKGAIHEKKRSQSNMKESYPPKDEPLLGKTHSNIVYFKPNKSQTIRELLNQMRASREQNNMLVLNSTHHNDPVEAEPSQIKYYNHQQEEKSRYFQPWREDEVVVFAKAREGENIWKKKFKESWLRVKNEREGKRSYFKRLIVRD